ncbi:ABC transporter transmembrane domain-containing protein [Euhalothece natronophila]|nr:ABC transporter transmembrane domain-containing protein [Euhalothece natronophila]
MSQKNFFGQSSRVTEEEQQTLNQFCQAFEILSFSFGELIYEFWPNQPTNFYFVCEGRVRLLGFDAEKERFVSIQVLEEGECFGGDSQLFEHSLPYQVFPCQNSSTVKVARIDSNQQKTWFQQQPQLQTPWRDATQSRQHLIFLKTFTELRAVPTHRLEKLLPYIQEKQIPPETLLEEATPSEMGRFWLRYGKIEPCSISAWGYPEDVPSTAKAQTSLLIYYLPKKQYLALRPDWCPNSNNSLSVPLNNNHRALPSAQPTSFTVPEVSPNTEVEFPQPKRRGHLRRYPFVEQQSSSDCGIACLVMISRYWQKRLSINFVRRLGNVGRSGTSLSTLAKIAETLGYIAKPVRASLNALQTATEKSPWIAHWQGDHYIVVYRIRGQKVLIADPARGKYTLSRQEFLARWTGYALLLEPTEHLQKLPEEKASLGKFFKLLLSHQGTALQIIIASLLIQIFGVVTPLFTQIILDRVVVNSSLMMLHVFALGILCFGIAEVILSGTRNYLLSYLSNLLDLTMVTGFIRHTLKLPLNFFESRHVGDIITRVHENQKIEAFLIKNGMVAWLDILMSVVYLGLMLYYNWRLTLLVIAIIPPIILLTIVATPWLRKVSRQVFNHSAEQNSALVEMMTGVETLKMTASEQDLRWRWEDYLTEFLNVRFKRQKLAVNLEVASRFINIVGTTGLLWYGANLVIQGQLSIGQLVAFNMLVGRVVNPILTLANIWDEWQEVLIAVERLNDIFTTRPEETSQQRGLPLPELKGEIRFEKVTFRYDADAERNTLEGITFEAHPGETIAIVGRSGSGKTTLIKLLLGLYYPNSGQIWIDDHDLSHISLPSLRSQLGVVSQECFLFSGTIFENITLFRPEFSSEDVIEAAKLAEAHSFIQAMPLGYQTKVGERGANLSGGQRQRIAIARALLTKPKVLILDEATSSLDTESEQRFQENLKRISHDRTTFIIAHRLSTVRDANCILVLDQGLLVEKGTHQELIANKKIYYSLTQRQLEL